MQIGDYFMQPLLLASSYSEDPISSRSPDNLRGNCQRELTGLYLSLVDQKFLMAGEIEVLQEHKALLTAKSVTLTKNLPKESGPKNAYDSAVDKKNTDRRQQLETLSSEIKLKDRLIREKRIIEQKALKKVATFEAALAPALLIKKRKSKFESINQAYNVSLVFKQACPKHNENCALNPEEQKTFEALKDAGYLPPTCRSFLRESKKGQP